MVTKKALARIRKSVGGIIDIASPSEENVQNILDWIMPDLDPKELENSLRYYYKYLSTGVEDAQGNVTYDERYKIYFDPLPALFSKYTFIQNHIKLTVKVGRNWWPYIAEYVKNPNYVLEQVGRKNAVIKQMLSTPLGQSFIEYYTDRLYTFFQLYFWKFPRYHVACGGLILYGLVNKASNSWGFYCRRCNIPFAIDDLDDLTYQKRLYPEINTKGKGKTDGEPEHTQ